MTDETKPGATLLQFDDYACVGDSIEFERDGFTITATIELDDSTSINDDDTHSVDPAVTCVDAAQHETLMAARAAWCRDEWFYCGVVLSVARSGVTLDDHAASLWGIECNYPDSDNSYLAEAAQDMAGEAVECGRALLEKLRGEPKPGNDDTPLARFTASYIEALYFSDTGEDGQPANDAELSDELRLDIAADCRSFWRRFGCYIETEVCADAFSDAVTQAGHDFHFTRNGHGVGFWEDEWPAGYRTLLTEGAQGYGTLEIYSGDDGLIYA